MTARRNFLRGVGIVSAFVAGAASYKQVKEIADENKDISHFAPPDNATTLQINGSYGEPPKPQSLQGSSSLYYIPVSNMKVTNSVTMTVGKDDRLWMKIGDQWKRVALES